MFCIYVRKISLALTVVAVLTLLVAACGATPVPTATPVPAPVPTPTLAPATGAVSYAKEILPLFQKNCTSCHSTANPSSGLNLETYAGVVKGNSTGPIMQWDSPGHSLLYQVLASGKMPQGGSRVSSADLQRVAAWMFDGYRNN